VQFYELDSAGIVHFSTYFRLMEEAEHALWRKAGLSIAPKGATIGFPRVSSSFEYRAPLRYEDEVDITIRIAAISAKSMRYTCTIRRGDTVAALGTMTIVCVRTDVEPMKAVAIPADIANRFEVAGDPGA
jgi:YbgC/YbaW family acyl-CoA thioester hydrolase